MGSIREKRIMFYVSLIATLMQNYTVSSLPAWVYSIAGRFNQYAFLTYPFFSCFLLLLNVWLPLSLSPVSKGTMLCVGVQPCPYGCVCVGPHSFSCSTQFLAHIAENISHILSAPASTLPTRPEPSGRVSWTDW